MVSVYPSSGCQNKFPSFYDFLQGQVSVPSVGDRQVHPIHPMMLTWILWNKSNISMITFSMINQRVATTTRDQMITHRWGWKGMEEAKWLWRGFRWYFLIRSQISQDFPDKVPSLTPSFLSETRKSALGIITIMMTIMLSILMTTITTTVMTIQVATNGVIHVVDDIILTSDSLSLTQVGILQMAGKCWEESPLIIVMIIIASSFIMVISLNMIAWHDDHNQADYTQKLNHTTTVCGED